MIKSLIIPCYKGSKTKIKDVTKKKVFMSCNIKNTNGTYYCAEANVDKRDYDHFANKIISEVVFI